MANSSINVKLYRLGFDSPVDYNTYAGIINQEGEAYNGGLVFARVQDDISQPVQNYIWAYGIEYHVADASAFAALVDDASINGMYTNEDSVHKWIQDAIIEAGLTAEKVYAVIDASNKKDVSDSSAVVAIEKSREGVNVSVGKFNGSDTSTLAIGIDLDKIYLPHGVQRTEAIGIKTESDNIQTEGVGMSVKELLEFWLVKEKFPKVTDTSGNATFETFGLKLTSLPKDIKDYIKINGETAPNTSTLVEVGSTLTIDAINGTLQCSSSGTWSTSKTAHSQITGMNFGYSTAKGDPIPGEDDHFEPAGTVSNSSSIIGDNVTSTATYTVKTSDLTVTSTLSILGNAITSSTTNSTYAFNSSTLTVQPGNNSFSLSLTHDATCSRSLSTTSVPAISSVYVISNKNHVAESNKVSVVAGKFTNNAGDVSTYSTTTYNVKGVYPIYANASIGADHGSETSFVWHGEWSMDPKQKVTPLKDIKQTDDLYFYVGQTNGGDSNKKLAVYVPNQLELSIASSFQTPTIVAGTYSATSFTPVTGKSVSGPEDTSILLNGVYVPYKLYTVGDLGATCIKLTLKV